VAENIEIPFIFPNIPKDSSDDMRRFLVELRRILIDRSLLEGGPKEFVSTRIGSPDNYTDISTNGHQTMAGTAKVWNCVDLDPETVKHPAANNPDAVYYPANLLLFDAYDDTSEEHVFFMWHVPSNYYEGAASIRGHFNGMVANENGLAHVAMGVECICIAPGDTFPANFDTPDAGHSVNITIANGEGNYVWHESDICTPNTTGISKEHIVLFRFFRDVDGTYTGGAGEAEDDNYTGDALIGEYHLEYLCDSLGEESI